MPISVYLRLRLLMADPCEEGDCDTQSPGEALLLLLFCFYSTSTSDIAVTYVERKITVFPWSLLSVPAITFRLLT